MSSIPEWESLSWVDLQKPRMDQWPSLNMGIHSTFDHGAVDEVNSAFVAENGKLHAPHNNVKRKHEDSPVDWRVPHSQTDPCVYYYYVKWISRTWMQQGDVIWIGFNI